MSENLVIATIGLVGTLLGAIITAYATIWATKHSAKSTKDGEGRSSSGASCRLISLGTIAAVVGGLVVGAICIFFGTILAALLIAEQTMPLQPGTISTLPSIPTPATFAEAPTLPTSTCQDKPDMFWMELRDTWYGPFLNGDALMASRAGGFVVWDADLPNQFGFFGAVVPYPGSFSQLPRNTWTPLQQSIFTVCIDSNNQIFGSVG